jgi:deazaflavin-dependent oxidoreductase (nitroreductase family)
MARPEEHAVPDTTPNHLDQAGHAHARGLGHERPVREFRMSRMERVGNAMAGALARVGIGPFHLLTTRGRKTGLPRTTPVTLVEEGGRRWLVAPYGAVSWVLNARAAGKVTVRRGRDRRDYAIREVGTVEAGPILKRYVGIARAARPYFQASTDSPVEDFAAEAHHHPVFELTPLGSDAP